jgi:hypothetical protein
MVSARVLLEELREKLGDGDEEVMRVYIALRTALNIVPQDLLATTRRVMERALRVLAGSPALAEG